MDVSAARAQLEAALRHQLSLAGADEPVEAAAEVLLAALEPAVRALATSLAEQAAAEVAANLPDHEVEVLLRDGEPTLRVRPRDLGDITVDVGGGDARVTLRLPEGLKRVVEEEADELGDSLNSWIVKTIASRTRAERTGGAARRMTGEFET